VVVACGVCIDGEAGGDVQAASNIINTNDTAKDLTDFRKPVRSGWRVFGIICIASILPRQPQMCEIGFVSGDRE
jgi:hypothetical protein